MEGPISDDEFEIVEHPEEEPTAVEPPRPELPFCEEAVPCQIADEISETVSREIIKDTKKLGAPKVQLHGSVHVLLGVVMLMGVLRLVGADVESELEAMGGSVSDMVSVKSGMTGKSATTAKSAATARSAATTKTAASGKTAASSMAPAPAPQLATVPEA